jgi:hypothetical protein
MSRSKLQDDFRFVEAPNGAGSGWNPSARRDEGERHGEAGRARDRDDPAARLDGRARFAEQRPGERVDVRDG